MTQTTFQYEPPRTLAEAEERRLELGRSVQAAQQRVGATPKSDRAERERLYGLIRSLNEHLRRIKSWVKEHHKTSGFRGVSSEGQELRTEIKSQFYNFLMYTEALENKVEDLEAENARLKAHVEKLSAASHSAPGSGVDEWRNEKR